jgi:hypothetical protein
MKGTQMKTSSKRRRKQAKPFSLRPYLIIGSVLLLAVASYWWLIRPNIEKPPVISVDQTQINFGDVQLGTPLSFIIRVTNNGEGPLRFKETPYIEVLEGC